MQKAWSQCGERCVTKKGTGKAEGMTLQILLYGCDDPTFVATVGPVQALKVPGG